MADEVATADVVCEEIAALFDVSTVLLVARDGRPLPVGGRPEIPVLGAIDMAAIDWAFARGEMTGRATGTLTAGEWQFHPLATSLGVLAVVGIARDQGDPVPPERRVLLSTMLGQAALAQERLRLEAEAREVSALRQRDNLRTTLVASMGHDLKTPLTSVLAAADALAAKHGGSDDAALLRTEARRLSRVFDDLVEMTRIDSRALNVRSEPIDLTDAVGAATSELAVELADRLVVVDVAANLPFVDADPRMLHHILINLIANAAKFSAVGTIAIRAALEGGNLCLAVEDEGCGLPPEREDQLFDRFERVEGDDRRGGSGLGLAIVKGFADAMGLGVNAKNRFERGARFELVWPSDRLRPMRKDAA